MTSHGQPDQPRSARYILKDYVNVSFTNWSILGTFIKGSKGKRIHSVTHLHIQFAIL